jgi:lysophospholipid acyltransferase (LPLAT)-like uncharacterized protein
MVVRVLALTWRVQRLGEQGTRTADGGKAWVAALWHGRMICLMPLRQHRRRGMCVLVSPSDDGGLATKALHSFGYVPIRGSLSRGGARAFREMAQALRDGMQLVVTPDGPRGPRHSMNVGVAWLARDTGAPILPVGVACDRAWRLRSWDHFTIPKPFARLVVHYGDPIHVASDASDEELEHIASRMRTRIIDQERDAFGQLGCADDLGEITPALQERDPNPTSVGSGSRDSNVSS